MILVRIDIGKNSHLFCVLDRENGEVLVCPKSFKNNLEGFNSLIQTPTSYDKTSVLICMEDTGHYHFAL